MMQLRSEVHRYAELSGQAGYNYASSCTVRHELDAFARRKTRAR